MIEHNHMCDMSRSYYLVSFSYISWIRSVNAT